jgi:hypothetical protein
MLKKFIASIIAPTIAQGLFGLYTRIADLETIMNDSLSELRDDVIHKLRDIDSQLDNIDAYSLASVISDNIGRFDTSEIADNVVSEFDYGDLAFEVVKQLDYQKLSVELAIAMQQK